MLRSATSLVLLLVACGPPPEAPTVRIEPEAPTTLDTLTAVVDDAADFPIVVTWKRDGAVVGEADGLEVDAALTARDQRWTVEVAYGEEGATGPVGAASTTIVNAPPTASVTLAPDAPSAVDEVVATATGEDPDGDAVTFSWRWEGDGSPIEGATADRVIPEGLARGSVLRVIATPTDGQAEGPEASAELTLGNTPPEVLSVAIGPDPATRAGPLTAEVVGFDADGDALTTSYAWTIDGEDAGISATVPADRVYRGASVVLTVTVSDGEATSAPASAGPVFVRNAPPTVAEARLAPARADETTTLTCTAVGMADADGDEIALVYGWTIDGVALPSATSSSLTGADFDRGDRVRCTVTPDDGDDYGAEVTSAEVLVENAAPLVRSGSITTASPLPGAPLTLTLDVVDPDGDEVELAYAWNVEGVVVGYDAELPSTAYTHGEDVFCRITPSDPFGDGATFTTATVRVANAVPQVTGVVFTPETPNAAEDLRASASVYDPESDPFNLVYTWEVEGTPVTGLVSDVLPREHLVRGQRVAVVVTVSDASGTAAPWRSPDVIVGNAVPHVGTARITPTPLTRATSATCATTGWVDADGDLPGYVYGWIRNGSALPAQTATLSSASFAKGDRLRCTVIPDDDFDLGTLVSSTTITVANAPPTALSVSLAPAAPRESDTLVATVSGLADPDPEDAGTLTATYTWYVNDLPVVGASGSSLNGSAFNRGDVVRVATTPFDGTSSGTPVQSGSVTIRNSAPVVDAVTISPSSPASDATLTAVVQVSDLDPVDVGHHTFSYRWRVDGFTVQESALGTLAGSFFARGQEVDVSVVASDGIDTSGRRTSAKVTVVNAPPTAPGVRVSPRWSRAGGSDLRCELVAASTDADNDIPIYSMTWTRNGQPYPAAGDLGPERTTYDGDTVPVEDLGDGETWVCSARATDGITPGPTGTAIGRTEALPLLSITSGTGFGCGLDLDGAVRCWGHNEGGRATPPDALFARRVATGGGGGCAITTAGAVRCWGNITTQPAGSTYQEVGVGALHACARNNLGSLSCWGTSTSGSTSPPAGIYKRLAVGSAHACALEADGDPVCWGLGSAGQTTPPAGVKFLELAAGSEFTCGLTTERTLRCWGDASFTSPPTGTFDEVRAGAFQACAIDDEDGLTCWGDATMVDLDAPPGAYAEVAPGTTHTCATRTDGTMTCWGTSSTGETHPPVVDYTRIAPGDGTVCGIRPDGGSVDCWGEDGLGQASPPFLVGALDLTMGPTHGCALLNGGLLFCWGDDTDGKATPPGGQGWAQVDAGRHHTCAVDDQGAITCWGDDTYGQSSGPEAGGTWQKVTVGDDHTCALSSTGSLGCWGASTLNRLAAPAIGTFLDVDAGAMNTCALRNDTTMTCWGDNQKGQSTPTVLPSWEALWVGAYHGCAWSGAGAATCWGETTASATTVPTTASFGEIRAGSAISCGVRFDGRSQCWGRLAY